METYPLSINFILLEGKRKMRPDAESQLIMGGRSFFCSKQEERVHCLISSLICH